MVSSVSKNAMDQDHTTTLHIFGSYYRLLSCLIARFPFQSTNGRSTGGGGAPLASGNTNTTGGAGGFLSKVFSGKPVRHVSFPTTWYDGFRHSNRVTDLDIDFEKYSILFNIASLLSRQATQFKSAVVPNVDHASSASDTNLKEACRLFQLSSGLFDYLSRVPEIVEGTLGAGGSSIDFNCEGLKMLSILMLAQGQACFFEKSTTTSSSTLVSKLAMGVSTLFHEAHVRCEKNVRLKTIAGKSDVYPWSQHCLYQMYCYQAAAHYWNAKAKLSEDAYGEEIGHLEKAAAILQQARKYEVGLLRNLGDNRLRLEQALTNRLRIAHKDNDTIYYASIPKLDMVFHPDAVTPVKVLNYFEAPDSVLIIDPMRDDPFTSLISPYLREQHDLLKGQILEVRTKLMKKISETELKAKGILEKLGLPASLDALSEGKQGGGLPEDVWSKVQETQFKGGVRGLHELSTRIDSAVDDAQHAFVNGMNQLMKESENDATFRQQFSHRWNRRPSEQLTVNFKKDSEMIQRFLKDAEESNRKVRQELNESEVKFEILKSTRSELDEQLPRTTQEQSCASQQCVETLRQLLGKLNDNTNEMKELLKQFETKYGTLDLMAKLVAANATATAGSVNVGGAGGTSTTDPSTASSSSSPTNAHKDLFDRELSPFHVFEHQFDDLEKRQVELLKEVTTSEEEFRSQRSQDDSTKRRQLFLQDINTSVLTFTKLLANFNEGLKFYSDLMNQRIGPFNRNVGDFCLARDMESKLILEQLTKEIAQFKEEEDDNRQQSVFPNPAAGAPSSSQGGGGVYGGIMDQPPASSSSAAGANNPNLAFEPKSQLYHMNPPTPTAAAPAPASNAAANNANPTPSQARPTITPQQQPPPQQTQQRPPQPAHQQYQPQQPQQYQPPQQQPPYNPYQQSHPQSAYQPPPHQQPPHAYQQPPPSNPFQQQQYRPPPQPSQPAYQPPPAQAPNNQEVQWVRQQHTRKYMYYQHVRQTAKTNVFPSLSLPPSPSSVGVLFLHLSESSARAHLRHMRSEKAIREKPTSRSRTPVSAHTIMISIAHAFLFSYMTSITCISNSTLFKLQLQN